MAGIKKEVGLDSPFSLRLSAIVNLFIRHAGIDGRGCLVTVGSQIASRNMVEKKYDRRENEKSRDQGLF